MYAGQVKAAIEHDEKLAQQWEAASAELLSYATMLANDMEALGVWKMPESWHMWQKRDHQPDKHWGQPLLDKIVTLKAQRDELLAAVQKVMPVLCKHGTGSMATDLREAIARAEGRPE